MDAIDRALVVYYRAQLTDYTDAEILANSSRTAMAAAIRAAVGEPVGWISCAERLPDDDADVVVWIGDTGRGGHHPAVDFFRDGDWMNHGYITHWMPAPPAPDAQPKPAEDDLRRGLRWPHDSEGTPT